MSATSLKFRAGPYHLSWTALTYLHNQVSMTVCRLT
jgi:hypothetical protein